MELIESLEKYILEKNSFVQTEYNENEITDLRLYKAIQLLFASKKDYSGKQIKSFINKGKVKVNNEVIIDESFRVCVGDEIDFEEEKIKIKSSNRVLELYNLIIENISQKTFSNPVKDIFSGYLNQDQKELITASIIRWEINNKQLKDGNSLRYNLQRLVDSNLGNIYEKNKISINEDFDSKLNYLENLILENHNFLINLISNLKNLQQINSFQQQIRRHISRPEFKSFFRPFIPNPFLKDDLDVLFVHLNNLSKMVEQNEKNVVLKKVSEYINEQLLLSNKYDLEYLKSYAIPLYNNILSIVNTEIFGKDILTTKFYIEKIDKKYPFFWKGEIDLQIKVNNIGGGFASSVIINAESSEIDVVQKKSNLGDFLPGERTHTIRVRTFEKDQSKSPRIYFQITWNNLSGVSQSESFEIQFNSQDSEVNWDKLRSKKPYSLKAIDNKDKLLGRDDLLDEFVDNFQSEELDSFILFGQRRVGKTSVVKSLMNWFNSFPNSNIIFIYLDCTNLRSSTSFKSLENLGNDICIQLKRKFSAKCSNSIISIGINSLSLPKFENTLSPLKIFLDELNILVPNYKIVIGIDEFDEFQYDLYKPGDLSETLFRNLRGLNNSFPNLAIILVGSEKMPKIYSWHGEQLNNWKNRQVDTFDKETQFEAFKKLIETPTKGFIKYSEEAINEIYEFSAGNPYFTNVICSWIFEICYQKRDSEVIRADVHNAVNKYLYKEAKTSFQHFWLDGILDSSENKDVKSDLRKRTLLALALGLKTDENFNVNSVSEDDLIKNFNPPPTLHKNICKKEIDEFISRKIFYVENNGFRARPKLFEIWLTRYGQTEIITGIADLEEFIKNQEIENSLAITDNEISGLLKKFILNNKYHTESSLKNWFQQFGKHSKQRSIYKILEIMDFISEEEFRRTVRDNSPTIFKGITEELKTRKLRRSDTIITYFNFGSEDNQLFAQKVGEVLSILKENIIKNENLIRVVDSGTKLILFVHPLLYSEQFVFEEFIEFWNSNQEALIKNKIRIKWLNFYSYDAIFNSIKDKITSINSNIEILTLNDIDINNCKIFSSTYSKLDLNSKQILQDVILEFFPSFPLQICHDFLFEFSAPQFSLPVFWYPKVGYAPFFEAAQKIYIYSTQNGYENNVKAKEYGDVLERKMLEVSRLVLEKNFGSDWWMKAVTDKIRKKCLTRWDEENRIGYEYNYLDFIDYAEIAKSNECLREFFFFDKTKNDPMQISKEKGTVWLSKLNDFRKVYSHPTRELNITDSDLNYIITMKEWFFDNLLQKIK